MQGGHAIAVHSVAVSPSGELIASAGADGTVKLWRMSDGALLRTLTGHEGDANGVAFSPDGSYVASAGSDGTVRVWRTQDGRLLHTLTHGGGIVLSVAFAPNGQLLASGGEDGTVKLWRVATGAAERTIHAHELWVSSVAFSPDGSLLASASADGTVKLWQVANGQPAGDIQAHNLWVTCIAFSPNGQLLASSGEDGTVKLWRVADGELTRTLNYSPDTPAYSVAFSSDGSQVAAGGGANYIRVWRVSDGTPLRTLTGHAAQVVSVVFVPNSPLLVSGGADSAIRVWQADTGALLRTLTGHTLQVASVAFAPNRSLLASGSGDSTVRIWRAADGGLQRTLAGHDAGITSVAFSPDGSLLASGSEDGTVKLWRTVDGGLARTLTAHAGAVASVAFSTSGQLLATAGDDGTVKLWRVMDGVRVRTINAHAGYVACVAFSPDGSLLATAGEDGAVKLWRVADWGLERTLTGHTAPVTAVAFSPNGRLIASGSADASVRLWYVSNGLQVATLIGHSDTVYAIAFSRDGGLLASGGGDGLINLWRISDGTRLRSYSEETGTGVLAIAFSPDGQLFGYGRLDATVVVARNPFPPNRPPAVPELVAPADGATVSPAPTLRVRLTDPDNDQVQAVIEVRDASGVVRTLETGFVASGSEASVSVDPPLAAGDYTWRARARDSAGNTSEWSAPRRIVISTSVPSRLVGIRTFALSLRTPTGDPNALGLNGVSIVRWDATAQRYAQATELRVGEAYFIKATNPVQPNLFGEPITGEITIPLKPGWNLIANPTLAPIEWRLDGVLVQRGSERRSLRAAQQAGWLDGYLWAWRQDPNNPMRGQYQFVYDASELQGVVSTLEPWQAYWILARVECTLVLNAAPSRAVQVPLAPSDSVWTLQVEAASARGSGVVWLGVAQGRSVQAMLAPEPPDGASPVQVRVRRAEGVFAADVRPTLTRDARWRLEVVVAPSDQPQPIRLRIHQATHLPRGVNLALVDEQSGARRPLRSAGASLTFTAPPEGGVFRFAIEPIARRTLLRVLNPTVRGGTRAGETLTLGFTLTAEAQVQVQIRTGSRTVRTLSDTRTRSAGLQEFIWDGRDDAGVHLPPGAYLAEITAVSADGQVARAVAPIIVRR
jgi:WD40 repeat protein